MSLKRILTSFLSNKLFAFIVISSLALIAATVACYFVFPPGYEIEDRQAGATILAILVGIFVLFFASTQIIYSVNDIPTELLRKHALKTKESVSLVIYFFIAILSCGFVEVVHPIVYTQYVSFSVLLLSLLVVTFFFFWLNKRITAQEIIRQIKLETDKVLTKINQLEKTYAPEFSSFHEFIRKSKSKFRYETTYCVKDQLSDSKEPSFSVFAKEQKDTNIGKIKVQKIEKKLSKIISDPHLKIVFEVEPTLPIPKKDPDENLVHNYRLLTLVFEESDTSRQVDYETAQKQFVQRLKGVTPGTAGNGERGNVSGEVKRILKEFGTGLEAYFQQKDYNKWQDRVQNTLNDLKTMFLYNLRNEQDVTPLCSAMKEIVGDQLFDLKPDVFLHVRYNVFRSILEMFKEINKTSLRKDDVRLFDNMLGLFYRLASTAAECRNPLIYDEVLEAIRDFHFRFVTTAPHAYNSLVKILVLNISELTTSILRGHFQTEQDLVQLDKFYKPIFERGVDKAFEVVRDYLNWYNEDKLHHQIYLKEQTQFLIDFMPFYKDRPGQYFAKPREYSEIKRRLGESATNEEKSQYELATKKAEIVKDLRARLQRRIMQLAIYMVALYKDKELDADVIWKIALPAAKSSCYEHGLPSFFTRLFNDYRLESDTQDFFHWRDIHPAGAHELRGFNLSIFWIVFNVYLGERHFFPTEAQEIEKKVLLGTFEWIDENTWARALNMKSEEFKERIKQYNDFAGKIDVMEIQSG